MQEFPGGKCEPGESPAACTIRECLEETGLRVEIDELLIHSQHDYSHGRVELSFFLCRLADSKTVSQGNFRWVPMGELALLNFPDGNREAVTTLLAREAERPGGVA
jgi:mutator protein MutT